MNLEKMFQMQKKLDDRIKKEHNLQGHNLTVKKIVAFQVELGELANETRCFKYWSLKQPSAPEIILEEYVDGIHFLLSIGLDLSISPLKLEVEVLEEKRELTNQFATIYTLSSELSKTCTEQEYISLFHEYFILGTLLGFTDSEIEKAYIGKNEVNHQRQNDGY